MRDVLVVDDDFMVARIHSRFVELTNGFVVCGTARTGAEALEMAADLEPDLVLLDVHLPDMSGIEVLDRLRTAGSSAGVLMVTAERDAAVVRQALSRGALQYVIKPFEQSDLAARLGQVADSLDVLGSGQTDQATIDRAFGGSAAALRTGSRLPKGLSPETADLVLATVAAGQDVSAAECGQSVGISRVTARRYLEYFVAHDRVEVRSRYGAAGRPERRYRRVP